MRHLLGTYGGRIGRNRHFADVVKMKESESPIEATMLEALEAIAWPAGVEIKQQVSIGHYRVDFLIGRRKADGKGDCLVVVECDGQRYHDPDEDAKRDRFIQIQGAAILRFTGSEINRHPARCASEVQQWMDGAIRRLSK